MSEEDNFDEDNVDTTMCIGGSGVKEQSTDYEITLTKYTPGPIFHWIC